MVLSSAGLVLGVSSPNNDGIMSQELENTDQRGPVFACGVLFEERESSGSEPRLCPLFFFLDMKAFLPSLRSHISSAGGNEDNGGVELS